MLVTSLVLAVVIFLFGSIVIFGVDKVRGWRDSAERIRDIAAAYQRGEDPFAVRDYPVGT